MTRHSVRRRIATGIVLAALGTLASFSTATLAADEPPTSPRAPIAVPDPDERPSPGFIGETPIYPLDEVRPGLRGVAKTVVRGTAVESFDVEVLAVLENAAPVGDLILIRVSGPVVERTGGIASGMSGSPVYIDGRLLGAIGYGFDMADPTVGMVTPIAAMRSVFELLPSYGPETDPSAGDDSDVDEESARVITLDGPVAIGDRKVAQVAFAADDRQAEALREQLGRDASVMRPVATPLLAGGFGPRTLGVLDEWLAAYPVTIAGRGGNGGGVTGGGITASVGSAAARETGSAGTGDESRWTAEPGSAFGVQLVRGDVSLNAIGTITAVAGESFLGFGHPFLNNGSTELYATGADIHAVVDSLTTPFKIGSVLDPIGTILQDRGAAVAGRLGVTPSWIPVEIRVQDEETRSIRLTRAEVADAPELAVALAASAALEGFDQSIDRIGPGTAEVTFEIEAGGLPADFVRENTYYSPTDISAYALTEMVSGLDLLVTNPFRELEIERVSVEAKVTRERHTAQIEEAHPKLAEVRAGETVDVEVTLRPFRQAPIRKVVPLEIPEETASGDVVVTVRGGGIFFAPMDFDLPSTVEGSPPPVEPPIPGEEGDDGEEDVVAGQEGAGSEDLEEVVTAFVEKERNNELITEFYPPFQYGPANSDPANGGDSQGGAPPDQTPAEGDDGQTGPPPAGDGAGEEPNEEDEGEASPAGPHPADPDATAEEGPGASGTPPDDAPAEPIRSRVETEYVMEGQQHFNLTILPPAPTEAGRSADAETTHGGAARPRSGNR